MFVRSLPPLWDDIETNKEHVLLTATITENRNFAQKKLFSFFKRNW